MYTNELPQLRRLHFQTHFQTHFKRIQQLLTSHFPFSPSSSFCRPCSEAEGRQDRRPGRDRGVQGQEGRRVEEVRGRVCRLEPEARGRRRHRGADRIGEDQEDRRGEEDRRRQVASRVRHHPKAGLARQRRLRLDGGPSLLCVSVYPFLYTQPNTCTSNPILPIPFSPQYRVPRTRPQQNGSAVCLLPACQCLPAYFISL